MPRDIVRDSIVRLLEAWSPEYQAWINEPDARGQFRATGLGHIVISVNMRVRYVNDNKDRGTIEHQFEDGLGHYMAYFRDGSTTFLFDPAGVYRQGRFAAPPEEAEAIRLKLQGLNHHVQWFRLPKGYTPVQIHPMDTWCQTWSLMMIVGGDWQSRMMDVSRYKSTQDRIILLTDFIDWLFEQAIDAPTEIKKQWRTIKLHFELYYSTANTSVTRRRIV